MKPSITRLGLVLALLMLLPLAACGGLFGSDKKEEPVGPPPSQYLEFKDVQIPAGMKLDREGSFVYETNDFRAGVLALNGRTPVTEILDFYQNNMPRDGWSLMSSFKYHKNILIYTKQNKVCLVMVTYPYGNDYVSMEIWVSPARPGSVSSYSEGGTPWTGSQPGQSSGKPKKNNSGPKEETLTDPGETKKGY